MVKKYLWMWKCQQCGLVFSRSTDAEPRNPCPICRDRGCKSFVEKIIKKFV